MSEILNNRGGSNVWEQAMAEVNARDKHAAAEMFSGKSAEEIEQMRADCDAQKKKLLKNKATIAKFERAWKAWSGMTDEDKGYYAWLQKNEARENAPTAEEVERTTHAEEVEQREQAEKLAAETEQREATKMDIELTVEAGKKCVAETLPKIQSLVAELKGMEDDGNSYLEHNQQRQNAMNEYYSLRIKMQMLNDELVEAGGERMWDGVSAPFEGSDELEKLDEEYKTYYKEHRKVSAEMRELQAEREEIEAEEQVKEQAKAEKKKARAEKGGEDEKAHRKGLIANLLPKKGEKGNQRCRKSKIVQGAMSILLAGFLVLGLSACGTPKEADKSVPHDADPATQIVFQTGQAAPSSQVDIQGMVNEAVAKALAEQGGGAVTAEGAGVVVEEGSDVLLDGVEAEVGYQVKQSLAEYAKEGVELAYAANGVSYSYSDFASTNKIHENAYGESDDGLFEEDEEKTKAEMLNNCVSSVEMLAGYVTNLGEAGKAILRENGIDEDITGEELDALLSYSADGGKLQLALTQGLDRLLHSDRVYMVRYEEDNQHEVSRLMHLLKVGEDGQRHIEDMTPVSVKLDKDTVNHDGAKQALIVILAEGVKFEDLGLDPSDPKVDEKAVALMAEGKLEGMIDLNYRCGLQDNIHEKLPDAPHKVEPGRPVEEAPAPAATPVVTPKKTPAKTPTNPAPQQQPEKPAEKPVQPIVPVVEQPQQPVQPQQPEQPEQPQQPVQPEKPVEPEKPVQPEQPVEPQQPVVPQQPVQPQKKNEQAEFVNSGAAQGLVNQLPQQEPITQEKVVENYNPNTHRYDVPPAEVPSVAAQIGVETTGDAVRQQVTQQPAEQPAQPARQESQPAQQPVREEASAPVQQETVQRGAVDVHSQAQVDDTGRNAEQMAAEAGKAGTDASGNAVDLTQLKD